MAGCFGRRQFAGPVRSGGPACARRRCAAVDPYGGPARVYFRCAGDHPSRGVSAQRRRGCAHAGAAALEEAQWENPGVAVFLAALAGAGILFWVVRRPGPKEPVPYTQITSLTDSAVAPALSPDGRMVAFYRSDHTTFITGQIYLKLLPSGEPVQVTHDPRQKYNLAFSPDGSRIAYTAIDQLSWNTYTVPSLGGDSTLLLPNASGLTWLDEHRLLFSEIQAIPHMGIVTATENRSAHREIYFPAHGRGMAHYS
jgi:hypothetical protein